MMSLFNGSSDESGNRYRCWYKTCIILLLFLGQFSGAFFWLRRYLEIITTLISYDK
jgi:hypothetical protein